MDVGDGKVSFWEDFWLKDQPIISLISRAGVPDFVRVENSGQTLVGGRRSLLNC